MPNSDPKPQTEAPPERFVEQVKQVLEHLYDFPALQRHPLVQTGRFAPERPGETAGQRLRREVLDAVETLSPGPDVSFRAASGRLYHLLHLRYVEGMTVQEAARELDLSLRQVYRDLRRAEESVATILWSRYPPAPARPEPKATQLSSLEAEMDRLEAHPRPTDVRLLLEHALQAVEQLARRQGISFQVDRPDRPVIVSTDPVVARQVLVNLLSYAVQQARPDSMLLRLTPDQQESTLTLGYTPRTEAAGTPLSNPVLSQLADRLDWQVEEESGPAEERQIHLRMTGHGPTVLVIDDNAGLVELLDRYLSGHACRVVAAGGGQEGLTLAQQLLPDAIMLDIMMPEMDGWELLQHVRTDPRTAAIPVIICSVFNDPELAYSLGASLFVPKPVSRDEVLEALRRLQVV